MKKITLLSVICCQLLAMSQRAEGQYTDLVNFNGANGKYPNGSLILSGTNLYGMTYGGGANYLGCVFSFNTFGNVYTDLLDFNGTNGAYPIGSLIISGTTLYGMTNNGGANSDGCVFSLDTVGNVYTDLLDFNDTNGQEPIGDLTLSGTTLYGMTVLGGAYNYGCLFSLNTIGNVYTDLLDFNDTNGAYAYGSLILSGTTLYGMTQSGGAYDIGRVFSFNIFGDIYTDLLDFNDTNGKYPYGSLTLSGTTLYAMTDSGGAHNYGCLFSLNAIGNVYTDLLDFNGTNGAVPWGSLTLSGTTLYGMTNNGGTQGWGCVFSFNTTGNVYNDLLDFTKTNGAYPYGSLILSGNTLYGMTELGGANNDGVIFSFTPPCNFKVNTTSTITCNGSANATATATPSGGTSPYTYSWNNSQTNATATGLSAGIYSVNVVDSVGCTGSASITITQPPLLQDSINSECATCCNCKGTTHVYAYGGTPPYTYSWSNGRTNDTMMGLASGTYTATVWDSNRCMITDSIFVHEGPSISKYQTNENCYGDANGSATITVDGNYSYSWNPGGETTASINGLSAGAYNVTITNNDTAGCSVTYSFSITQPDSLFLADGFGVNGFISCADTDCIPLFFQAYGGTPPYTYINLIPPIWMLCNSGGISGTVIDANGCSASIPNGTGVEFGLSIRVEINNNAGCNGENYGNATVSIHTGSWSTYAYSWNPGGGTNQTETSLSAGTYTVTVTAINPNCATSAIIAISQSPAIILTADTINASPGNCNGSAWATASGGVAPYTYSWNPGGLTSDTITNQCAGAYCCTITDANGCIDSVCTNIETSTGTNEVKGEREKVKVYPNPNDGKFTIQLSVVSHQSSVEVYNVLGEKVYSELSIVHFPLSMDLSSQPDGVYFYRVLNTDGGLIGEGKLVIQK